MRGRVYEQSPFFWIVPDVHCCHQTFDVPTSTEFTLCYAELIEMFFDGSEMLPLSLCRPEDNSSALFFDSSRSLMRSESYFCLILCGSSEVRFKNNSRSLEVDGCGVSTVVFSSSSSQSREKLSGSSRIVRPSQ
jgi:hypothetical protein